MQTFAQSIYDRTELGAVSELPGAGTAIENPCVDDASAKELNDMASRGLVRTVEEHRNDARPAGLIRRLSFQRLR
jgi:hypothetical protein